MWEIDSVEQLLGFLYSAALGGIFCLGYDILRAVRAETFFSNFCIFVQDVVFSLASAVVCFLFLLGITGGELRSFVFVGLIAGFVAVRLTVSKIFFMILKKTVKFFYTLKKLISELFCRIFSLLFVISGKMKCKIIIFFKKFSKDAKKA